MDLCFGVNVKSTLKKRGGGTFGKQFGMNVSFPFGFEGKIWVFPFDAESKMWDLIVPDH